MKQLHQKIEARKQAINLKKQHLKRDYRAAKKKLLSPSGLSLTTIGGIALGFLLLPKKFKIIKGALKAYTIVATLRQVIDLLPHSTSTKKKSSHKKSDVV